MLLPAPAGPSMATIIVWVTESRRSKKPGKLTATASAPSIRDAFARDEPGDGAEHRDPVVAARVHRAHPSGGRARP